MWTFDQNFARIPGNCKWDVGEGILPLSVADMDFQSPPCVVEALRERIETGLFG